MAKAPQDREAKENVTGGGDEHASKKNNGKNQGESRDGSLRDIVWERIGPLTVDPTK